MLLHRHPQRTIACFYRRIAIPHHVLDFHIQHRNRLPKLRIVIAKLRILTAKRLHLLGVRGSTLLLNAQHEPH